MKTSVIPRLSAMLLLLSLPCLSYQLAFAQGNLPSIPPLHHISSSANMSDTPRLHAHDYLTERATRFGEIAPERRAQLDTLATLLADHRAQHGGLQLTCICTHNSRRSHLAMIWAAAAALYYEVPGVVTYSGGTEATAFNPRAVAAIARTGLPVQTATDAGTADNPHYHVELRKGASPLVCFSKVYDQAPNPQADFVALMVCSHAEANCPLVHGASARFALPYVDPKESDGTPQEADTYDARTAEIARDMLYLFAQVRKRMGS